MDDRIDSPLDGAEASPATTITTTTTSGEAQVLRYPKRKRNAVKYAEFDEDSVPTDTEEPEFLAVVKVSQGMQLVTYPTTDNPQKGKKEEKSLTKKDIFPFMKLPPELRNKIYTECLKDGDSVYLINTVFSYRRIVTRANAETWAISSRTHNRGWRWGDANGSRKKAKPVVAKVKPLSPHLLAVSKTIYAEAANILFGQPIIVVDSMTLFHFAGMLTARTAPMVHDITIAFWCHTTAHKQMNYASMQLLSTVGVTCLDRLYLDCRLRPYGTSGTLLARKVYRDFYPWIRTMGEAKGNPYAVLDVVKLSEVNFKSWMDQRPEDVRAEELENGRAEFREELESLILRGL